MERNGVLELHAKGRSTTAERQVQPSIGNSAADDFQSRLVVDGERKDEVIWWLRTFRKVWRARVRQQDDPRVDGQGVFESIPEPQGEGPVDVEPEGAAPRTKQTDLYAVRISPRFATRLGETKIAAL
ncbi:MAG TPA: hypothetical protein VFG23_00020 [Polyangia bacterium]|nr:hypothetical protein [Polyangia bacterium]